MKSPEIVGLMGLTWLFIKDLSLMCEGRKTKCSKIPLHFSFLSSNYKHANIS